MNSFLVIVIFGSLLMASFLLVTNPINVNKKANRIFGVFLLLWSTFWMEEIMILTGLGSLPLTAEIVLRILQFFTPIVFYFATLYFTNPDFKFEISKGKHGFLPLLYTAILIVRYNYYSLTYLPILLNTLVIGQALFYIVLSYFNIQDHKKKINLFASNTIDIDLSWIENIIKSLLVLCLFIGVYNIFFPQGNLNLIANLFSLSIILFVSYHSIQQKEIFTLDEKERIQVIQTDEDVQVEKKKLVSDHELEELKHKLTLLMKEQQPYLDPELSLSQLSDLMNITPHRLSYLINVGFDNNFFMYVNTYRVEKVKENLLDSKKKNLAILGIAFESGFNSKTSFYSTFKKITNQTPSEFLKMSSGL